SAEVPGCVHTALQRQGFISDPYYRYNDLAYRWISLDNWTSTTSWKAVLVFEGVDTVSTISLNGVTIGKTDNMFRRHDFEVTDLLKDEDNILQVWIMSAVTYASQRSHAHTEYRVPPDCPPPVQKGECHVNFIRKAQSSFSWDWGPSFPTLGIWKGVRLEVFNTLRVLSYTTNPRFGTHIFAYEGEGILDINIISKQINIICKSLFPPYSCPVSLHVFLSFSSVSLWWPFGHGEQTLYDLMIDVNLEDGEAFNAERMVIFLSVYFIFFSVCIISLLCCGFVFQVAFRTVELVQEPIPSSPGLSFYFWINGKPIFLKGSNWIPVHAFQE
uniref:beta-mannosidase n=1 Tax=Sinocyclocheilus grahami TaxID=75366 RepID=A0A672N1W2_SINGR